MRTLAAVVVLVTACSGLSACSAPVADAAFPKGFLWGVATAGFQNDPGCPGLPEATCEDTHSDWYHWITDPTIKADPGTYVTGEPLSHAPGSYELYPQDFDLVARSLHGGAVRLSLEWSRIFPTSTIGSGIDDPAALKLLADPDALAHYHAVFAALKQRGLKPLVTLHHYTLPEWIHDGVSCHKDLAGAACQAAAGWIGADVVPEIAKYAGFAAREFGGEVDLWATLNEPFAVLVPGFLEPTSDRSNPPGVSLAFPQLKIAAQAMLMAHAQMYDAIHKYDQTDADGDGKAAQVGLVYNTTPTAPHNPGKQVDVQGAKNLFYIYNQFFLNAAIKGDYDQNLDGTTVHRADLAGRMDYLGINYYTRIVVDGLTGPAFTALSPLSTFNPLTLSIWNEYPQGIYEMAMLAKGYGVPSIITENGTSDLDDPEHASRFIVQHLAMLQQAIAQGAQVLGYFYWTLVDNYEWNHGMSTHFGLYGLDGQKGRTPRPAVDVLGQVMSTGSIPAALLVKYQAPGMATAASRGINQ